MMKNFSVQDARRKAGKKIGDRIGARIGGKIGARIVSLGLPRFAPEGTRHWWAQRITAFVLAVLTPWFVLGVVSHIGEPRIMVRLWLGEPLVALLMAVFVVFSLWHTAQGLRVVLDDYVHNIPLRDACIRLVQIGCAACAFVGLGALGMIVCDLTL